jgi:hypothetical protein
MNFDLLKNPIIIGIIAGVLTYGYMTWEADRKHKQNPKSEKKNIGFITPAVVAVITWFLASSYFDSAPVVEILASPQAPNNLVINRPLPQPALGGGSFMKSKPRLVEPNNSFGSDSYHLIGKNNVKLPPNDVFIDLARF